MADLAPGSSVSVENPRVDIETSMPGLVADLWLKEGPSGPPGATGGRWYDGTGAPATGLGAVGDWYINTSTSDVYEKTGASAWTLRMNIKGAPGTNGTNGVGVPAGGTAGQTLSKIDASDYNTQWTTPSSGGGGLLAAVSHDPATALNSATSSTTFVDVDATNLAITFTAPASGKVLVRLTAVARVATAGAGYWGLREGTTQVAAAFLASYGVAAAYSRAFLVTGLAANSSHTYKWAHRMDNSSGSNTLSCGGSYGPAVIEVISA